MEATEADVQRMLHRKPMRRGVTREMVQPSSGVQESRYGPIVQFSPSYGKRGEPGTRLWAQGWHACAGFVCGDEWAIEHYPDLDLLGRLDQAEQSSPWDKKHAQEGWAECASYCRSRLNQGTTEAILVHDLVAIVDTFYNSKKARRPNLSNLLKRGHQSR